MKVYKALLIATLLAGCTSGFITPKAYERATAWCASHDGIYWASVTDEGLEYWALKAVCRDGVTLEQRFRGKP